MKKLPELFRQLECYIHECNYDLFRDHVRQLALHLADAVDGIGDPAHDDCYNPTDYEKQADAATGTCAQPISQESHAQGTICLHEWFEDAVSQRSGGQEGDRHHGLRNDRTYREHPSLDLGRNLGLPDCHACSGCHRDEEQHDEITRGRENGGDTNT